MKQPTPALLHSLGRLVAGLTLAVALALVVVSPTLAHQPFFEDEDATANAPWRIDDPTVSLSLYATLDSPGDVDYFVFPGRRGQTIPVELLIPQIPGQEDFAPMLAIAGPGIQPTGGLPDSVRLPEGAPARVVAPPTETSAFFEPFSRTSYWWRQRERLTFPADGDYWVAVWDANGQRGRYVLAIGDREIPGGDPRFLAKRARYWTPVAETAPSAEAGPAASQPTPVPAANPVLDLLNLLLQRDRWWTER